MKYLKNIMIFFVPLISLFLLTFVISINFGKLMRDDLEEKREFEISDNEKVLVFNDRIENINKIFNADIQHKYSQKYEEMKEKIRDLKTGRYHDAIYEKLCKLSINNSLMNKEEIEKCRATLKITQYQDVDILDIYMMENLKSLRLTYTLDEENIYFLLQDFRPRKDDVNFDKENIDKEKIIQESKKMLQESNIASLQNFFPNKIWLSENEGRYMLEDLKNDIIVCYDLIEERPIGFVKGFSN